MGRVFFHALAFWFLSLYMALGEKWSNVVFRGDANHPLPAGILKITLLGFQGSLIAISLAP
jgi:hypothetical protein